MEQKLIWNTTCEGWVAVKEHTESNHSRDLRMRSGIALAETGPESLQDRGSSKCGPLCVPFSHIFASLLLCILSSSHSGQASLSNLTHSLSHGFLSLLPLTSAGAPGSISSSFVLLSISAPAVNRVDEQMRGASDRLSSFFIAAQLLL